MAEAMQKTSPMAVVTALGPRGMITLRGDLAASKLKAVCKALTGADIPAAGHATVVKETGLAWMSPDELLIMLPHAEVPAAIAKIDAALKGSHYLAVDVSDARAVFRVCGSGAREVMGKLCPVDLHPDQFAPGQFRRTRMGQIAAAFWMRDAATFEVVCFRSVADYAFDLLTVSAKAGPVGYY
ncbi:sarcosine oxidase subunit gamma [Flavimaricola marinus]|uniref:Sarcosine oxidase, gamma subunit family n=1 Tax=Flavimaricola marinus TaxID=1819565 RepID=A0A238LJN4_9RHOB|nr:sarcosine oxidase subunit gamma family protein [Flavimaricola marinus]SMY09100.1 Sarcosine oxidase, gamma subunit family [Flavimaricola marinus]